MNQNEIKEILQQVDISQVIGHYLPLIKQGQNYKALCPFHDDTKPSLMINTGKQIFKCFACQSGGNAITFIAKYEHINFIDAIIRLAEITQLDISNFNLQQSYKKIDAALEKYYQIFNDSLNYVTYTLAHSLDSKVKQFLAKRQISDRLTQYFEIGYNDPNHTMLDYLLKKKYSESDLLDIGLAWQNDYNLYDLFKGRILFPIHTAQGQIVAYTARALDESDVKYINSNSNKIYQKSHILYNYHRLDKANKDYVILCEGVMDVLAFVDKGIKNVLATLGTALSNQQIELLKRLNCEIILAYDADRAGFKANYEIGLKLKQANFNISILKLPHGMDPDDLRIKQPNYDFQLLLQQRQTWLQFVLQYALVSYGNDSYVNKRQLIDFYLSHLVDVEPLDQAYFIKQLSQITDFDEALLINQIKLKKKPLFKPHKVSNITKKDASLLNSEKILLEHMLSAKQYCKLAFLQLDGLINPDATQLFFTINAYYDQNDYFDEALFYNLLTTDELVSAYHQLQLPIVGSESVLKDTIQLIRKIKIRYEQQKRSQQSLNSLNTKEKLHYSLQMIKSNRLKDEITNRIEEKRYEQEKEND